MRDNLIIIGAGKFGREVYSWAKQQGHNIIGFLDNRPQILNNYNYPIKIIESAETYYPKDNDCFVCAIGDPKIKKYICSILESKGAKFINIIHPTAILGENVKFGIGNIFCPYSIFSCDITIGNHVAVNFHTAVAHDVIIKDYCQINANITINGNVTIKEGVQIGSNACMLPGSIAEEYSIVGAGTVVTKYVPPNKTIFGVPGKIIS